MRRSTSVFHFMSTDTGAPVLTGAAGAMIDMLYACLVTGYNPKTPTSITRDGAIVTVTFASAHGFRLDQILKISGADQSDYNGVHRIDYVDTLTLRFELDSGVTPTTPATGTFETRVAPAGWERPYTGTNLAAFRSADVDGTQFCLYSDDTNLDTRRTRLKGYESMVDISTRYSPFPYSSDDNSWVWWYKYSDTTTTVPWVIVADSRMFYIHFYDGTYYKLYPFGDFVSLVPGDAYACAVGGEHSYSDNSMIGGFAGSDHLMDISRPGCYAARGYAGLANSPSQLSGVPNAFYWTNTNAYINLIPPQAFGDTYATTPRMFPHPHLADNGMIYERPYYWEGTSQTNFAIRGWMPGVYAPLHGRMAANKSIYDALPDMTDRKLILLYSTGPKHIGNNSAYYGAVPGCCLIDIIGPWR